MHPDDLPGPKEEKAHYLTHNNDVHDPRFQAFVAPIVTAVLGEVPSGSTGLDYGAGSGPVISHLLGQAGYAMRLYDPYFHPDASALRDPVDFIVCCEVVEHFFRPEEEFERLRGLLRPGGRLYIMTVPIPSPITQEAFSAWFYKNDQTHAFFYSTHTMQWIRERFGFGTVMLEERLTVFTA